MSKSSLSPIARTPNAIGVVIIVQNLPVPFDRRVWQEAVALKTAGYQVSVISPKGKSYIQSYECIDGVHVYRHPLPIEASRAFGYLLEYTISLFWEFFYTIVVLKRHGFDIIHACNPPDLIFIIGYFYKIFFRKRFLFDHHDICPELWVAKTGKKGVPYRILGLLERCTFRVADASIATNDTFKRIAVERGNMDPDHVWVVKSYPDLSRFYRLRPKEKDKSRSNFIVGYLGIIGKQDGVNLLLDALAYIVKEKKRSDVRCIIIGDGPELGRLMTMAQGLDLSGVIRFAGYKTGDELLEILSTLDMGVIPDPYNEYNDKITMNKVFEYMIQGLPIVQFALRESRETAGDAALNVEETSGEALGEAILELVDDPVRRQAMSKYGMARAHNEFNWDLEKLKLIEAYRSLVPATR